MFLVLLCSVDLISCLFRRRIQILFKMISNFLSAFTSSPISSVEALVVPTKENGIEVNADKTKYMVMSREQTAGLNHTMKVGNSSIERVEEFK